MFSDTLTLLRVGAFCRRHAKVITSTNEQRHDLRLLGISTLLAARVKLVFSMLTTNARCAVPLQRISVHAGGFVAHQQLAPSRDRAAASGLGHRRPLPQRVVLPFPHKVAVC